MGGWQLSVLMGILRLPYLFYVLIVCIYWMEVAQVIGLCLQGESFSFNSKLTIKMSIAFGENVFRILEFLMGVMVF